MILSMKILFITSSRIGDAVLSTGLLDYLIRNNPDCEVTVACGPLVVSLFEGCPQIKCVVPLKKEKWNGHWLKLWKQVAGTRWDIVVDLRDSAVSRLVLAQKRYIFGKCIDKSKHKVEQNAQVMGLSELPSPRLWLSKAQKEKAEALIPGAGKVLAVGPTANWIGKTWPAERFIEIVRFMIESGGVMDGARVAVFGAPGEEDDAYRVFESIPKDRRLDLIAKGSPGVAAAALARCDFYIGNDSGLMHCAAAAGVPTIGLFGPSYPHIYAPWGAHTDYVRTPESFDELIDFEGYNPKTLDHSLMDSLDGETVKLKISEFCKARPFTD